MNKHIFLVPLALLGVFLVFHHGAEQAIATRKAAHTAQIERERSRVKALKEQQAQLAADQTRLQIEKREREELARSEKKRAEYEAALRRLTADADSHRAAADELGRAIDAVQQQLADIRARKESADARAFALAQRVELQRVEGRNAELELQRALTVAARRWREGPWAKLP